MAKRQMKLYTVILDGIDKSGKDTIRQYIWHLDKALNVICRGYISLEVYNRKFNRNIKYAKPLKNVLYVLLVADKEDWQIRCEITNEPTIDYATDDNLFNEVYESLDPNIYYKVWYDTSHETAYDIAKKIVALVNEINNS